MQQQAIVHYPCLTGNPYNALIAASLRGVGIDIVQQSPVTYTNPARSLSWAWQARLVHFHWMQGLYTGRSTLRFVARAGVLLATLTILRLRGTRLVLTVHNLAPHEHTHRRLHRAVHKALGRIMHRLVTHSEPAARDVAAEYGTRRQKIGVIEHVDYGDPSVRLVPQAARALLALPPTRKLLLLFGAIRAYKGVDRLLAAAARLDALGYDVIIAGRAGSDSMAAALQAEVASHGNVHLRLRALDDPTLSALLQAVDLVIFPYRDGLSSGAAHLALAHGRPFVCSRSTAFEHLVEAGIGIPLASDDPAAIARAVFAAERIDPVCWQAAVASYRQRCRQEVVGARLKALYAELLDEVELLKTPPPAAAHHYPGSHRTGAE